MYTQCSSCKTLFRITDEQLASVGGKVRCGFCYSTFNAYDALFEELPGIEDEPAEEHADTASYTEAAVPPSEHATTGADEVTGFSAPYEENWPPPAHDDFAPAPMPAPAPQTAPRLPAPAPFAPRFPTPALPVQREFVAPPSREAPRQRQATADYKPGNGSVAARPVRQPLPTPPPAAAPEHVSPPLFPFPQTAPVPASGPALEMPGQPARGGGASELPRLFDAIDVAGRELQQVTRGQLDRRPRGAAHAAPESKGTLAWTLATLLLLAFIVIQYGYFMRNDLARFPQLRPWLEKICDLTGCTIPLMYTPHLIKLVSRDIRSHPTESDALQVRARILNEAPYPQAYPVLSVELSDINGKVIASRFFQPKEYLPAGIDIEAGIAPKAQADIHLDLLDPSHAAVGFEFAFL